MNVASLLSGKSRSLDRKVEPDELVREDDAADTSKLARLLTRVLRDLADLRRRFAPRRTDFEDVHVGTGTYHRFPHRFGGRVRWWVVDAAGAQPSMLRDYPDAQTDADTLVLYSYAEAVITLRVEEAG